MKQNRLSTKQKQEIISLLKTGLSRNEVASRMNVTWKQVNYWSKNEARVVKLVNTGDLKSPAAWLAGSSPASRTSYSYLLGVYLGDGFISLQNAKYQVLRLNVACDSKYPNIIQYIKRSMELVFKGNRSNECPVKNSQSVNVFIYSQIIDALFPQRGPGVKHTRDVSLHEWQWNIVKEFPKEFIKGLIHSDGSRYVNDKGYTFYNFTNGSIHIINEFIKCCKLISLAPTVFERKPIGRSKISLQTVTFNKREDVELLDTFVGPKC